MQPFLHFARINVVPLDLESKEAQSRFLLDTFAARTRLTETAAEMPQTKEDVFSSLFLEMGFNGIPLYFPGYTTLTPDF